MPHLNGDETSRSNPAAGGASKTFIKRCDSNFMSNMPCRRIVFLMGLSSQFEIGLGCRYKAFSSPACVRGRTSKVFMEKTYGRVRHYFDIFCRIPPSSGYHMVHGG
jgi:hypothetical protein